MVECKYKPSALFLPIFLFTYLEGIRSLGLSISSFIIKKSSSRQFRQLSLV